jgi:hypothetical protein
VYSLPESAINAAQGRVQPEARPLPYPNPADRLIHIPVTLPSGDSEGTLELFDLKGNLLLSYPVTGIDTQVILPVHLLVPGTYLYYLQTATTRSETGKIIVPQ